MTKCPAITRAGAPCRGVVPPGATYCPAHDPYFNDRRRMAASRAGKARHTGTRKELVDIKEQAATLYREVRGGRVGPKVGIVLTQLTNTQARILELERKWLETLELEARVVELERMAGDDSKGGRSWG